jgi:hypothetical protein
MQHGGKFRIHFQQTKARSFRFPDTQQWAEWCTCFTEALRFFLDQALKPVTSSGDEFAAYV